MAEKLVWDVTTPEGERYRGLAEVGVNTFRGPPEQIAPTGVMGQVASKLVAALRSTQGPVLRTRAWADTAPTFYTTYRLEITVAAPEVAVSQRGFAVQAMPFFPIAIIVAILLILGMVALAAWQISRVDWGAAGAGIGIAVGAAILLLLILMKGR